MASMVPVESRIIGTVWTTPVPLLGTRNSCPRRRNVAALWSRPTCSHTPEVDVWNRIPLVASTPVDWILAVQVLEVVPVAACSWRRGLEVHCRGCCHCGLSCFLRHVQNTLYDFIEVQPLEFLLICQDLRTRTSSSWRRVIFLTSTAMVVIAASISASVNVPMPQGSSAHSPRDATLLPYGRAPSRPSQVIPSCTKGCEYAG